MALSADRHAPYTQGEDLALPVGANKQIYAGSLVCLDGTTRLAEPGSDASGKIFVGVAQQNVDNNPGNASAKTVLVKRKGLHLFPIASAAQTDVGKAVFVLNDGAVALSTGVSHSIYCGVIAALESSTSVWVDIFPALIQSDVAAHIADTSAAHAASAIALTDAGDHFATAENNVEAAIQKLAKTITLCFSAQTIATAASDAKIAEDFELPVAVRVKRAYATLTTAPGSGKTLTIEIKVGAGADATLVSVSETAVKAEAENLDIPIAADTDFDIQLTQNTGSAAGLNLMLVCQVDDGE